MSRSSGSRSIGLAVVRHGARDDPASGRRRPAPTGRSSTNPTRRHDPDASRPHRTSDTPVSAVPARPDRPLTMSRSRDDVHRTSDTFSRERRRALPEYSCHRRRTALSRPAGDHRPLTLPVTRRRDDAPGSECRPIDDGRGDTDTGRPIASGRSLSATPGGSSRHDDRTSDEADPDIVFPSSVSATGGTCSIGTMAVVPIGQARLPPVAGRSPDGRVSEIRYGCPGSIPIPGT